MKKNHKEPPLPPNLQAKTDQNYLRNHMII